MIDLNCPLPAHAGDIKRIGNLLGSAAGLVLQNINQAHKGLILVVTPDSSSADQLASEAEFYCGRQTEIMQFPDWETLPYDNFSPHQDIISQRISTLQRLPSIQQGILIVPISTLMHRLADPAYLAGNCLTLKLGDTLNVERLREQLTDAGYHAVDTVFEHGEFAVRGSILDIYPMGASEPYRIDLFDDEIDSLRTFDPETQRSTDKLEAIELLPAKEFPFDSKAINYFKLRWRDHFDVDYRKCPVYQDVEQQIAPAGIEYYLPLFFEHTSTLFDHLPKGTLLVTTDGLENAAEHFYRDVLSRYEERRHDVTRPLLEPSELFLNTHALFSAFKELGRLHLGQAPNQDKAGRVNLPLEPPAQLAINHQAAQPLKALEEHLKARGKRTLFCAESAGRREALLNLFNQIKLKPAEVKDWQSFAQGTQKVAITTFALENGLVLPDIELITENQLFGQQVFQRRRRSAQKTQSDQVIKNLTELNIGAPVVHLDHGVGRYQGLQTLNLDGQDSEFLVLEYADNAKLYVPVAALDMISRYTGATDENAPLHRLGTEQWSKAKRKAAEAVRDTAAELLDIYARRAARKGFSSNLPKEEYQLFAAGFPFEETPDQASAIERVIHDMNSPQPMDRLVCGDVGFGKTEVAMRAAFIAAQNGKQVAVLVPTTLLAQQHFDNFRDRFADWPVNIELISRARSAKQQTAIAEGLRSGQTDIIIGTHKLLSDTDLFKDLGLVIIDEEHRFGVQQKEKLKSLRSEVDILTMTATPIPRTLNMAMSGMRDLSIIATPPARRLSVKTFVRQTDDHTIKEAILRELLRGGQVYLLHNEVKSIEKRAQEISDLVPEARVAIGHGQMRERELEQVMSNFYHKRSNVLVCSTIIETGIDVPNANTIIIERADKFGLAQLHQLRGRVGRSHHQAYAYLMTPPIKVVSKDAQKRLEAISQSQDLGAGFTLATHDLEIRGAGELLGDDQSGQMQTIGFSLYMEMLEQAVEAIKAGKTPNMDNPLQHGAEVNLRLPALIPDDYLPDVHNRLIMYKRISNTKTGNELHELQVEMIDRFGLLPEQVKNLFRVTEIKQRAEALGIRKIDAADKGGRLEFSSDTNIDPLQLVKLVQAEPGTYRLEGAEQLRFQIKTQTFAQRFETIENLLDKLAVKN